jgi:hypothetical protein
VHCMVLPHMLAKRRSVTVPLSVIIPLKLPLLSHRRSEYGPFPVDTYPPENIAPDCVVNDIRTGHPSLVVAPVSGLSALMVTLPLQSPRSGGKCAEGGAVTEVGEVGVVPPPHPKSANARPRAVKALQYMGDRVRMDALGVPGGQRCGPKARTARIALCSEAVRQDRPPSPE